MAQHLFLVDTSILIDYFRKPDKQRAQLYTLVKQGHTLRISAITEWDIYTGIKETQRTFWKALLEKVEIMPFGSVEAHQAVLLQQDLKRSRKQLSIADLFIAATALVYALPLATLNRRHFERVSGLKVM